jgi:hypothetical protein
MPCYDVARPFTHKLRAVGFIPAKKKHILLYRMCLAGNIALLLELLSLLGADGFQTLG